MKICNIWKISERCKVNVINREGLEIGSNNTLLVEEGTSARITHYDLRSINIKYIPIKQPMYNINILLMERRNFCKPEYANVYNAGLPQGDTRANGASGHSLHPPLRTASRWHIFHFFCIFCMYSLLNNVLLLKFTHLETLPVFTSHLSHIFKCIFAYFIFPSFLQIFHPQLTVCYSCQSPDPP